MFYIQGREFSQHQFYLFPTYRIFKVCLHLFLNFYISPPLITFHHQLEYSVINHQFIFLLIDSPFLKLQYTLFSYFFSFSRWEIRLVFDAQ